MMSQCVETQSITQCKDQKRLRRRSVDGTKSQNPTVAKKPKWKYSRSQTLLDFSTQSGRVSPPPVLLSPSVPRPSSPESYSTSSVGTATQSLEQDKAAENHSFSTDLRARLHNWALLFSLPHLVMLSNLQKLIGVRSSRPTIQPNEYMDNLLSNAKATMKERGLNRVSLPDQQVGVALYDGKMTGLTNLHRRGDAVLEAETDHFILSFAIDANDIRATYWWKKRRLKGEVTATVAQVTLQLKIKQMIQNSPPPELLGKYLLGGSSLLPSRPKAACMTASGHTITYKYGFIQVCMIRIYQVSLLLYRENGTVKLCLSYFQHIFDEKNWEKVDNVEMM